VITAFYVLSKFWTCISTFFGGAGIV